MKEPSAVSSPVELIATLRYIRVGCLTVKGEEIFTYSFEFTRPITEQQLLEELEYNLEDKEILFGYIAFSADDQYAHERIMPDLSEDIVEAIHNQLAEEFLSDGRISFRVVQDPKQGLCHVVPVEDGNFVLLPIADSVSKLVN